MAVSAVLIAILAGYADLSSCMTHHPRNASNCVVMERNLILIVMMVTIWMVMDAQEIARCSQVISVWEDHLIIEITASITNQTEYKLLKSARSEDQAV